VIGTPQRLFANPVDSPRDPDTFDVDMVLLSKPIYVAEYGALPTLGQFEYLRTSRGDRNVLGVQNFQFTNSPGKGNGVGGTCSGDSGGPAFWVDPSTGVETNTVMAVNSYSVTPLCNGVDYQIRTDISITLDFVKPYLGWTATGSGKKKN
jgi:hypothetical protein